MTDYRPMWFAAWNDANRKARDMYGLEQAATPPPTAVRRPGTCYKRLHPMTPDNIKWEGTIRRCRGCFELRLEINRVANRG